MVWLVAIHGERPQHVAPSGTDRYTPAGAQSEGQRQMRIRLPQRIGGDVRRDYRLRIESRGPARAYFGTYRYTAFELFQISYRQIHSGYRKELSIPQQHHGAEPARRLCFDKERQIVKNCVQRLIARHSFEQFAAVSLEHGCLLFAGNVFNNAFIVDECAGSITNGAGRLADGNGFSVFPSPLPFQAEDVFNRLIRYFMPRWIQGLGGQFKKG